MILDPLAVADAQLLDQRVGVDLQAVLAGDLPDLRGGLGADAVQLLGAEHHVFLHRQVVGQHEVWCTMRDAGVDRLLRRGEPDAVPVDLDLALGRGGTSRTGSSSGSTCRRRFPPTIA
jgi:hypothetical protein